MIDLLIGFSIAWLVCWGISCIVLNEDSFNKADVGLFFIWPLFALRVVVAGPKALASSIKAAYALFGDKNEA